ncbi:MAG: hypothetical protein QXH07_02025 [Thermoplasmata archaeon]
MEMETIYDYVKREKKAKSDNAIFEHQKPIKNKKLIISVALVDPVNVRTLKFKQFTVNIDEWQIGLYDKAEQYLQDYSNNLDKLKKYEEKI